MKKRDEEQLGEKPFSVIVCGLFSEGTTTKTNQFMYGAAAQSSKEKEEIGWIVRRKMKAAKEEKEM